MQRNAELVSCCVANCLSPPEPFGQRCGTSERPILDGGTDGSNPVPSTGESATNWEPARTSPALLLGGPDVFFGNLGELVEGRQRPVTAGADRNRQSAAVVHHGIFRQMAASGSGVSASSRDCVLTSFPESDGRGSSIAAWTVRCSNSWRRSSCGSRSR